MSSTYHRHGHVFFGTQMNTGKHAGVRLPLTLPTRSAFISDYPNPEKTFTSSEASGRVRGLLGEPLKAVGAARLDDAGDSA